MRVAFTILSMLMFAISYTQNVGIGITSPAAPLHIRNNSSELLRLEGNDPFVSFYNSSGVAKAFVSSLGENLILGTGIGSPNGVIQFFNYDRVNMVIHPNSNVGIGISVPGFKLTVGTVGTGAGVVHTNSDVSVGTAVGQVSGINGGWYGTFSNHPLMFFTNASAPQMTLMQNGNLGIGTSNPLGRVHINSGGNALTLSGNSPYIYYLDAGNVAKGFLWNKGGNNMDLGTEVGNNLGEVKLTIRGFEALTVQNDGRVRVGEIASIHTVDGVLPEFTVYGKLCIKDDIQFQRDEWAWRSVSGALIGQNVLALYKNGALRATVNDNGDWNETSDISLKEDVRLYKNVLNDILKLEISTFHYKWNTTGKPSFGLIAQNVAAYFPEIVSELPFKDGQNLLGVSYAKTGVLAIKAIQEQQEIIETQQKKIDELEKRLANLENKLK